MPAKPNEIKIVRIYDAPVKLVWDVWTDLKHVEKWWGPRGFTITTKSKDLRPGGKWIYTMHGPDGKDWPNIATYHEVEKYKKLVYDHGATETTPPLFTVTATFEEKNGKTVMTMISTLPTAEQAKMMKQFIRSAGGESTWDRLAEYLEKKSEGKEAFVIARNFEASVKDVFEKWTNPEAFSNWLGPVGSKMSYINENVKEGGSSHWAMTMDGDTKYGMINYKTITPNQMLIYTQNFCDKDGKLCKPPFAPTYPDTLQTTVTFAQTEPNETLVTVRWEIFGQATEEERQTFSGLKTVMTGGWSGSFDKLDALLNNH